MQTLTPTTFIDTLKFPEAPRWRGDLLWVSDMRAHRVITIDTEGSIKEIAHVPERPSGLGFLPDGRLQVVSMSNKQLLRQDPDGLSVVADLSSYFSGNANDMVMDAAGNAYVGNTGYSAGMERRTTCIVRVTPAGEVRVSADDLNYPNGCALSPDERTFYLAESDASRISTFTIQPDGSMTDRQVFAEAPGTAPDGICVDAEGAVWFGSYKTDEFMRVKKGGEVTHHIETPGRWGLACTLGGDDGRTLFMCTAETTPEQLRAAGQSKGRIETVRVDVPGTGSP